MNRRFFIVMGLAPAALCLAADNAIDGKWKVAPPERREGGGEGRGGPGGPGGGGMRGMNMMLDLKADGSKLTGKVITSMGENTREAEIKDGAINGDKFSFTVVQNTPRGELTVRYHGTVEGDELKGDRTVEEMNRSLPFRAEREK